MMGGVANSGRPTASLRSPRNAILRRCLIAKEGKFTDEQKLEIVL